MQNGAILPAMNQSRSLIRGLTRGFLAALMVSSLVLCAGYFYLHGQDKSGFPDGYDAMQAAPDSHKVVYENEFVRVLEVSVPPAGLLFRCIITGGRVSFWIGIAAVARHIFAIIDRRQC